MNQTPIFPSQCLGTSEGKVRVHLPPLPITTNYSTGTTEKSNPNIIHYSLLFLAENKSTADTTGTSTLRTPGLSVIPSANHLQLDMQGELRSSMLKQ